MMWRWLRRIVWFILLVGLSYLAAAFGLNAIPRGTQPIAEAKYRYFACDNGVHVDVTLPVVGGGRDWRVLFPPSDFAGDVRAASFVSLGWGARGFFATTPRWQDIRPGPVAKALFWMDSSVLHVVYHGDPNGAPHCRALMTDAAGKDRLFAFIDASLVLTEGRPVREPVPGYSPHDGFYAAYGRYSLFRTCNVWSAEALQVAGQKMGYWSPFSFQVMSNLSQATAN
jgi:uncharacterized protein (TIGR02117 family)